MSDGEGRIELERQIDSITVGVRHRKDPGDIGALMRSIEQVGLLQPVTVTPDGVLVCGWRRLEAMRRLGRHTLNVWVRSGISDELSHLLAQQDENEQRKPLSPLETAHLYEEIKRLEKEDAARRQVATRFGSTARSGGSDGPVESTGPHGHGDARSRAAQILLGHDGYTRLEQINWIARVAEDPLQPPSVREFATNMLAEIDDGCPANPAYKRVKAAVELAAAPLPPDELNLLATRALARAEEEEAAKKKRALKQKSTNMSFRTTRSFILTWTELEGWAQLYDVRTLVTELTAAEVDSFERVVAETVDFAERLRAARQALVPA